VEIQRREQRYSVTISIKAKKTSRHRVSVTLWNDGELEFHWTQPVSRLLNAVTDEPDENTKIEDVKEFVEALNEAIRTAEALQAQTK
jgi:HEPN domain-containing protein